MKEVFVDTRAFYAALNRKDRNHRAVSERPGAEAYAAPPPEWGKSVIVSCSS